MDYYPRRNRRRRPRSQASNQQNIPIHFVQRPPSCGVFSSFCNFLILASLMAIIYLMLDHHCKICSKKNDIHNITMTIKDIALNISRLKESYSDLEKTVTKFSEGFPKIESQIEILEALANTMESGDFIWKPKYDLAAAFPNMSVFLKEPNLIVPKVFDVQKNFTEKIVQAMDPVDLVN